MMSIASSPLAGPNTIHKCSTYQKNGAVPVVTIYFPVILQQIPEIITQSPGLSKAEFFIPFSVRLITLLDNQLLLVPQ